jgi:biopolymer transport protein ExbD
MSEDYEDDAITGVEITPLVGVALVLVMIFMVTAPLFMQPVMDIMLPEAITGEAEEKENVTLTISKDGLWAVNENEYPPEEISYYLREKIEKSRDKFVVIRADQQAIHKWLLKAMSIGKECGAKEISIAVEQKQR